MKDVQISKDGSKLVIKQAIKGDCAALKSPKGKITRYSAAGVDPYRNPESWVRKHDPHSVIGVDRIDGECTIEIDIAGLLGICWGAAVNKTHKAQDGPIRVSFTGERKFDPESEGAK